VLWKFWRQLLLALGDESCSSCQKPENGGCVRIQLVMGMNHVATVSQWVDTAIKRSSCNVHNVRITNSRVRPQVPSVKVLSFDDIRDYGSTPKMAAEFHLGRYRSGIIPLDDSLLGKDAVWYRRSPRWLRQYFCKTTRRYIPGLHTGRRENLKSHRHNPYFKRHNLHVVTQQKSVKPVIFISNMSEYDEPFNINTRTRIISG
jgi:hypothetical protein